MTHPRSNSQLQVSQKRESGRFHELPLCKSSLPLVALAPAHPEGRLPALAAQVASVLPALKRRQPMEQVGWLKFDLF